MFLNRFVMSSISLAAMGLALGGVANGQEIKPTVPPVTTPGVTAPAAVDTGIADGAITRNGKLEADASANPQTPDANAAASANVNASGNGINGNAAVGTDGQTINSQTNSNSNPGLNVLPNGNQSLDTRSYNSGQDYSASRPSYDMVGNSGNYSGMPSTGYQGGSVAYGHNSQNGHSCCSAQTQVSQSYHHGRRHRCGRQHHNRHCCR